MGMYDSLLVSQSLLDDVCKSNDLNLKPFGGFYDFQTKDLDNSLTVFYLQEDGSFVYKKQDYEYVEPEEDPDKKWNFGHLAPVGASEMVVDDRNAYIDFYDLYNTETERVFVTFTAHLKNGKLLEPISVKSIERTNIEEEAERFKKGREQWDKIQNTWQWRLASFISNTSWKFVSFFRPLSLGLSRLETNLRQQAKDLYEGID